MRKSIKYLSLIITVSLTLMVSCSDFFDEIENFNVGVTNAIFEQSAVIELKDYFGDQENLINTDLKVEFSGADADKLVNEAGELVISETDGFIQLNVNPNKSNGVQELNFAVTISGGSYRTQTFPVTLTDTVSHVRLSLVDESKIYKGTNTATETVVLTSNATSSTVIISTDKSTSLNKSAVTINTGTQFKDATGNTLIGTDINVEVINTDGAGQALQFTDNLSFEDINGAAITGKTARFITGNTSIKMKVGGTAVKTFNSAIEVIIEIPSDVTDPTSNNPVKIGDNFPIYTSEDNSTAWTYHGIGKVAAGDTTDTFNIAFETTHLSDYAVVRFEDRTCNNSAKTYNLTATNLPVTFSGLLEVEFFYATHFSGWGFSPFTKSNLFSVWIQNGKMTNWIGCIQGSNATNVAFF